MRKCSSCGQRLLGSLEQLKCIICRKEACFKCNAAEFKFLLTIKYKKISGFIFRKSVYACSPACVHKFEEMLIDKEFLSQIVGTSWLGKNRQLFEIACFKALERINPELINHLKTSAKRRNTTLEVLTEDKATGDRSYIHLSSSLYDFFIPHVSLAFASNLAASGRYLEAARIYENLKMYDKAKELRETEKQVLVKNINVSVDLNRLLKQIKAGGIVVVYRCPHCNAALKVGKHTKVEQLRICEHCGSEIESMDIADFLKTALS